MGRSTNKSRKGSQKGHSDLEEPQTQSVDSSVSSIFLEDERSLKHRDTLETVPALEDFNIRDYDLGEDYCNNEQGDLRRSLRGSISFSSNPATNGNEADQGEGEHANPHEHERSCSYSELVATLGSDSDKLKTLHPTLERRVRDFRFARRKRREKHGTQRPWGTWVKCFIVLN